MYATIEKCYYLIVLQSFEKMYMYIHEANIPFSQLLVAPCITTDSFRLGVVLLIKLIEAGPVPQCLTRDGRPCPTSAVSVWHIAYAMRVCRDLVSRCKWTGLHWARKTRLDRN